MDLTLWHANPHKVLMMVFVAKALKGSRRLSFFTDCSFLSASLRLFISVFRPSIVTPFDCLLACLLLPLTVFCAPDLQKVRFYIFVVVFILQVPLT